MSLLLLLRNAIVDAVTHGRPSVRAWSEPAALVRVRSRKRGRLLIRSEAVACVRVQSRPYLNVRSELRPEVVVAP